LLIVASHRHPGLLTYYGDHRLMIHLCVVQTIQQVDSTRPRSGHTYSHFTGEFGMRAGHKGSHLFMPRLDEIYLVLCAVERAHDAVDPIPRITIDPPDTPGDQSFYNKIAD